MKKELVLATQNTKKAKELKTMLAGLDVDVKTLNDFDPNFNIIEDADTFRGNAIKKALSCARHVKKLTLADDSGLVVPALGGAPGVMSARFAGVQGNDKKNIAKLLKLMRNLKGKKRQARFVSVIAIAIPEGLLSVVSGTCSGLICRNKKGKNGFGYDPVFYIPRLKKTFAELLPEQKNKISHRAKALAKAKKELKNFFVDKAELKKFLYQQNYAHIL